MKKVLLLFILTVFIMSCETIDNQRDLLGTWTNIDSLYTNNLIELTFLNRGVIEYYEGPNPYGTVITGEGGKEMIWKYNVSIDSLEISYESAHKDSEYNPSFHYITKYKVIDKQLILYNFSADGIRFRQLYLLKK